MFVSSVPLSQLWVENFNPNQLIIMLFWATMATSTGDAPTPLAQPRGMRQVPALPPLGHGLVVPNAPQQIQQGEQGSDHISSADNHTVATPYPSASEYFVSPEYASVTSSSF